MKRFSIFDRATQTGIMKWFDVHGHLLASDTGKATEGMGLSKATLMRHVYYMAFDHGRLWHRITDDGFEFFTQEYGLKHGLLKEVPLKDED